MTKMLNNYKRSKIVTKQDADIFSDFADLFNELNDDRYDEDILKEFKDLDLEDIE